MLNNFKSLALASAIVMAPLAASAATVTIDDNDMINPIQAGIVYNYDESSLIEGTNSMNPDVLDKKVQFGFTAGTTPQQVAAATTELSLRGTIKNAVLSWFKADGTTQISSVNLGSIEKGQPAFISGTLNTVLTADNNSQILRLSWDELKGDVDLNVQVAAVPLPAAGLLLLGALGGLGAVRRARKSA